MRRWICMRAREACQEDDSAESPVPLSMVEGQRNNENQRQASDVAMGENTTGTGAGTTAAGHIRRSRHESALERMGSMPKRLLSRSSGSSKRLEDSEADRWDKTELGRKFQNAVSCHDWELAESFIPLADPQRLNDGLCVALDSLWFLSTEEELAGAMRLIEKLIQAGADDFTRATLRTAFLVSCVSACRSRTMSLSDTVTVMAQRWWSIEGLKVSKNCSQFNDSIEKRSYYGTLILNLGIGIKNRLHDRLKESNEDEDMKADAAAKVQRFTDWALKCIGSHSKGKGKGGSSSSSNRVIQSSIVESRLQLMAFKRFLELAGSRLTVKDITEAFDAACFPLTLFSNAIDPGWATGIAATAMQGLLGILVEAGADNVNQCFLEASRFGSTELVRILLQIARRTNVEVDVDLALGFAAHYCKMSTMECLVDDGGADAFLGPLMRAAERGSMQVVEWFVERGCKDMELCLALTAAAASCRLEVADYLLARVPRYVLQTLSVEIIKAAGERSSGSLGGIAFLLQSDFLSNPEATYRLADTIAKSEDEAITPELRIFLRDEWSEAAFARGRMIGEEHHLNVIRVMKKGESDLRVDELPLQLQAMIAYSGLYKECVAAKGIILSQLLRGQLIDAAMRLSSSSPQEMLLKSNKHTLLSILHSRFPSFLIPQ